MCNRCSLVCDDVLADVAGKELKSLGLCRLGHAHLEQAIYHKRTDVTYRETTKKTGLELDDALEKAATMLVEAQKPLLYGLSSCTNETAKELLSLAKTLKSVFDSNASLGLCQAMRHNIHEMKLETDFDTVLNEGEFILYWGSNPVESSHRHASRFTVFPRGDKVPQGVESRVIGVVDIRETETMKMANHRIILPVGHDSELLSALIADLGGESSQKSSVSGVSTSTLVGLAQALKKSDFTVIFYGSGLVNSGKWEKNLSSLAELIQMLKSMGKKAYAMPMWHQTNDMGIVKSLAELAGTPSAIDFGSGKVKPLNEVTTIIGLSRGIFDVALVVGDDPMISLPGNAAKGLAGIKTIYVGSAGGLTDHLASISIHATDDMIIGNGQLTRLDMKQIQLKSLAGVKESAMSIHDVLLSLHRLVKAKLEMK